MNRKFRSLARGPKRLPMLLLVLVMTSSGLAGAATRNREAAEAYEQGLALLKNVQYDRAIEVLATAIRLDPRYAEAYYQRGNAFLRKGWSNWAIADFTAAIRINPSDAKAFNNRGVAYGEIGRAHV